jgi:aminoglycoside phosphotransferase (APT) family kinase protein
VQQPLSFEQARAQLQQLARLHAYAWPGMGRVAPDWVVPHDPLPEGEAGAYQRGQLRPEVYAHYMSQPRGVAVSRQFHDRERMEAAMERLRALDAAAPRCLLHVDPHLGNLYFDADNTAGILDWQSVRTGPWAHDVCYQLVSALDVADRPRWERALLALYLDALRDHDVAPPSFDEAWEAYRLHHAYGLYYWLVNPVEFQTEVNNCAVTPRFAAAALEHGTFELLLGRG